MTYKRMILGALAAALLVGCTTSPVLSDARNSAPDQVRTDEATPPPSSSGGINGMGSGTATGGIGGMGSGT